jgi:hypothetical protein
VNRESVLLHAFCLCFGGRVEDIKQEVKKRRWWELDAIGKRKEQQGSFWGVL